MEDNDSEYIFDDETIRRLEQSTMINNLLCKAIKNFDNLTDAEKDLLDRLIPCKGLLYELSQTKSQDGKQTWMMH